MSEKTKIVCVTLFDECTDTIHPTQAIDMGYGLFTLPPKNLYEALLKWAKNVIL